MRYTSGWRGTAALGIPTGPSTPMLAHCCAAFAAFAGTRCNTSRPIHPFPLCHWSTLTSPSQPSACLRSTWFSPSIPTLHILPARSPCRCGPCSLTTVIGVGCPTANARLGIPRCDFSDNRDLATGRLWCVLSAIFWREAGHRRLSHGTRAHRWLHQRNPRAQVLTRERAEHEPEEWLGALRSRVSPSPRLQPPALSRTILIQPVVQRL